MELLRPGVSRPPTLSTGSEYEGFSDRRTHDSRESAISVLTLAEKASHSVCGNGTGFKLLLAYYAGEASWWSFTEPEQPILREDHQALLEGVAGGGVSPGKRVKVCRFPLFGHVEQQYG